VRCTNSIISSQILLIIFVHDLITSMNMHCDWTTYYLLREQKHDSGPIMFCYLLQNLTQIYTSYKLFINSQFQRVVYKYYHIISNIIDCVYEEALKHWSLPSLSV
jgi:hypothetical protein